MKRDLKKNLSLTAGIIIGLVAFYSGIFTLFLPIFLFTVTPSNGDSLPTLLLALSLVYFVFFPICVFIASLTSGLIYQPDNRITLKYTLQWTPGLYLVIPQLFNLVDMPYGLIQIVGSVATFYPFSLLGLKSGIMLKKGF